MLSLFPERIERKASMCFVYIADAATCAIAVPTAVHRNNKDKNNYNYDYNNDMGKNNLDKIKEMGGVLGTKAQGRMCQK